MSRRGFTGVLMALAVATSLALLSPARAEAQLISPNAGRVHTYEALRRSPARAVGYDALFPGAGSVYVRLYGNTIASAVVSLLGAALWIHGGLRDNDGTYWSGVALFAAGRTYGLVSAGVGAHMLNRALRRQLQLGLSPTGLQLRF